LALILVAALAGCGKDGKEGQAEQEIVNPDYARWAPFNVDDSVTHRIVIRSDETETEKWLTTTITAITEEKITVSVGAVITVDEKTMTMPAQPRDIPATITKPEPPKADAPKPVVTTGSEDVTVGEETFACTWTQTVVEQMGATTTAKVWTSDKVPGGQVKMTATVEGPDGRATTTMALVDYKTGP
jgi:hypothetical protein